MAEPHTLAFVVVKLDERWRSDQLGLVLDMGDAIDAVPGCEMEGCASFPESVRPLVIEYMEAARRASRDSQAPKETT